MVHAYNNDMILVTEENYVTKYQNMMKIVQIHVPHEGSMYI